MTTNKKETVQIPRHSRAASVEASSYDADDNTVQVVWTTGADVLRSDPYDGNYIERLATKTENVRLDRLNAGANLLDSHNSDGLTSVIGSVVQGSARMDGGLGYARVKLSNSARAADTVQDIRDGIIRNISVGYAVHTFERTEPTDGSPAIMTATDWEPLEISACSVPADPGAQIQNATRSASGVELNTCTIVRLTPIKEAILARDNDNDKDKPEDDKFDDEARKRDDDDSDGGDDGDGDDSGENSSAADAKRSVARAVKDALAAERMRMAKITELARTYRIEDLGGEHCARGTSVQAFKDVILESIAKRSDINPVNSTVSVDGLKPASKDDRSAGQAWARSIKAKIEGQK